MKAKFCVLVYFTSLICVMGLATSGCASKNPWEKEVELLTQQIRQNADYNNQKQNAIQALTRIDHPKAVPALMRSARDEISDVRWAAMAALVKTAPSDAIPVFVEALSDNNRGVRLQAVKGLGRANTETVVPALIQALYDEHPVIIAFAVKALASMRCDVRAAVPHLILLVRDLETEDRYWEWVDSRPTLFHVGRGVRPEAVKALGCIGDRTAVPTLINVLREVETKGPGRGGLYYEIVCALGRLRHPSAVSVLEDTALNAKVHTHTRGQAINSLKKIGTDEAMQIVEEATQTVIHGLKADDIMARQNSAKILSQ